MVKLASFLLALLLMGLIAWGASGTRLSSLSLTLTGHESGQASWYGKEEQGKLTANGEHFDRHQLTAAHLHLPFNTIIQVTNRENGRTVQVRINDRGPYKGKRILDLSEAAADVLDMKRSGVVPVDIQVMPPGTAIRTASEP